MSQTDNKRKILIATSNEEVQTLLKNWAEKYILNAQCAFANDGSAAISKIQNVTPHILIASVDLALTDGYKLTQWVLRCKPNERVAVILLSAVPPTEKFVEEVVTSQVQFADLSKGEEEMERVISNAINFVFSVQKEYSSHFILKGDQLIKEGEKADKVYLVKTGELEASSQRGSEKVVLGRILPGEFVGEMAFINGVARSADVFACTDCELIAIPINILDQVLFTKPAWSKALMKTLTKRLQEANKKAS